MKCYTAISVVCMALFASTNARLGLKEPQNFIAKLYGENLCASYRREETQVDGEEVNSEIQGCRQRPTASASLETLCLTTLDKNATLDCADSLLQSRRFICTLLQSIPQPAPYRNAPITASTQKVGLHAFILRFFQESWKLYVVSCVAFIVVFLSLRVLVRPFRRSGTKLGPKKYRRAQLSVGSFSNWGRSSMPFMRKLSHSLRPFPFQVSPVAMMIALGGISLTALVVSFSNATDLRHNIMNGTESCFRYSPSLNLFEMNCSVLNWQDMGYDADTYISLGPDETFDGSGGESADVKYSINLSGIVNFEGLIVIASAVTTFSEAPLIQNVHLKGGELSRSGGYIVRKEQKYFVVDSCSSTGEIGNRGGGICGEHCAFGGEAKILNSYTTGTIERNAGGMTGYGFVSDGGMGTITGCYSTGNIGKGGGAISGHRSAHNGGTLFIKQCYSTGDIGENAGGILGASSGDLGGSIRIQECFSTGKIGDANERKGNGGGISGVYFAGDSLIENCYSTGAIDGRFSGGIVAEVELGSRTSIVNSYTAGVIADDCGGILAAVYPDSFDELVIKYSVYNEKRLLAIGGDVPMNTTGNSADLEDIQGKLYSSDGIQRWDDTIWTACGPGILPILRFQGNSNCPSPSPTPSSQTSSPTPSSSSSPSHTSSSSSTATSTSSNTATPTVSRSNTASPTISSTSSTSPTNTVTRTPTSSTSPTNTVTRTPTSSKSPTNTVTPTPTVSTSPTTSSSGSMTPTSAASKGAANRVSSADSNISVGAALIIAVVVVVLLVVAVILFARKKKGQVDATESSSGEVEVEAQEGA